MTEDGRLYYDPQLDATIFDDGERPMEDPDRPPPPSSPAPPAAAPAARSGPLTADQLIQGLATESADAHGKARSHAATAQAHRQRAMEIAKGVQVAREQAEKEVNEGVATASTISGLALRQGLAGAEIRETLRAAEIAEGEYRRELHRGQSADIWSAEIELGHLPLPRSTPAPAAGGSVSIASQADEYGELDDETRRVCGLPPTAEETESSHLTVLDGRVIGLA